MLRELVISIYLFLVNIIFTISKLFRLQNKSTFVVSFTGNIPLIIEELYSYSLEEDIVVIQAGNQHIDMPDESIKSIRLHHPLHFIQSIYHLATSRRVFVDNYYGFLTATKFKDEVNCIQVWHAVGALKSFGLNDMSNELRSEKALRRFQMVYDRFDTVVVGSYKMEQIFRESFGITEDERFLRTGIPRTDFFFDNVAKQQAMTKFSVDFPLATNRKVILYAPTYREDELGSSVISLQMDLDKMYEHFKSDYILLLRLHPAMNHQFKNKYPGFIFNVSQYESLNTLLIGSDILITDYSSIPFEYALLNKPMIFYTYDLDAYRDLRGLPENYEASLPGPIAFTTDEIVQLINEGHFDLDRVRAFAKEWNEFSHGNSTQNFIEVIYDIPEITEQVREHV